MKFSFPSSRENILKEERRKTERGRKSWMCWRKILYRMAVRMFPHSPSSLPVSYQATLGGIHEFIVISTAVQYSSFGFYSSLILSGTLMWIWEAAKMGLNASCCIYSTLSRNCPLTVCLLGHFITIGRCGGFYFSRAVMARSPVPTLPLVMV